MHHESNTEYQKPRERNGDVDEHLLREKVFANCRIHCAGNNLRKHNYRDYVQRVCIPLSSKVFHRFVPAFGESRTF